jgi:isopentenyl diphosphate isomerase/L-lactate dehydrogenase-like FMN-dependent dehydrogenase
VQDLEAIAAKKLPKNAYDYYRSGANGEITLKETYEAFKSIKLKQRGFVDPTKFKGT